MPRRTPIERQQAINRQLAAEGQLLADRLCFADKRRTRCKGPMEFIGTLNYVSARATAAWQCGDEATHRRLQEWLVRFRAWHASGHTLLPPPGLSVAPFATSCRLATVPAVDSVR